MSATDVEPAIATVTAEIRNPGPADRFGWDSEYARRLWVPVLGPTSFLLGAEVADWLGVAPSVTVPLPFLAATLGLGEQRGRQSPLVRSITRLTMFRVWEFTGSTFHEVECRLLLPRLSDRSIDRLHPMLRDLETRLAA